MDANELRGQPRLPLHRAVDWILSECGSKIWDDRSVYVEKDDGDGDSFRNYSKEYSNAALVAAGELLERLKDGSLKAFGYRDGDETRELEEISPGAFPNDVADNPYGNTPIEALLPSDRPKRYLVFRASAQIRSFRTVHWSGIAISGDDALRLWPSLHVSPLRISSDGNDGIVGSKSGKLRRRTNGDHAKFFDDWKDDYAPLGVALQWIASKGGSFDPWEFSVIEDGSCDHIKKVVYRSSSDGTEQRIPCGFSQDQVKAWTEAAIDLLRAIRQERLTVRRLGDDGITAEQVPKEAFAYLKMASPGESGQEHFDRMNDRKNAFLVFGAYADWPHGEGDTIQKDGKAIWKRLAVAVADILRQWPFTASSQSARRNGRRSGAPPTVLPRVIEEMQHDIASGDFDVANEKEEAMAARYKASRDTCRRARSAVLEIVEN